MIDPWAIVSTLVMRAHHATDDERDVLLAEAEIVIANSRLPADEREAFRTELGRMRREALAA